MLELTRSGCEQLESCWKLLEDTGSEWEHIGGNWERPEVTGITEEP